MTINTLCRQHLLPLVDRQAYRALFSFPVIHYYKAVGFDISPPSFDALSRQFMDIYHAELDKLRLHSEVAVVLDRLASAQFSQSILSASRQDYLELALSQFNIAHHFQHLGGVNDIYANGKIARGQQLMSELGWDPQKTVLIGDTYHDFEVAQALGVQPLLISHGHQCESRLASAGCPLFNDLNAVAHYILATS